jgi:hypothetical protein
MAYDVIYDNVGPTAHPPQLPRSTPAAAGECAGFGAPFLSGRHSPEHTRVVGGEQTAADARQATSATFPTNSRRIRSRWNLSVQHVFHNDYTAEVRYLGTRGVHLLVQQQINRVMHSAGNADPEACPCISPL